MIEDILRTIAFLIIGALVAGFFGSLIYGLFLIDTVKRSEFPYIWGVILLILAFFSNGFVFAIGAGLAGFVGMYLFFKYLP